MLLTATHETAHPVLERGDLYGLKVLTSNEADLQLIYSGPYLSSAFCFIVPSLPPARHSRFNSMWFQLPGLREALWY